jgi:hypothetical protein
MFLIGLTLLPNFFLKSIALEILRGFLTSKIYEQIFIPYF